MLAPLPRAALQRSVLATETPTTSRYCTNLYIPASSSHISNTVKNVQEEQLTGIIVTIFWAPGHVHSR